jgi:MFS family permease
MLYLLAIQGSVQISSAFFTPYMLKQLHFSYLTYVTVVAAAYLAKAAALPWWGRVAQRWGARRLLWIGGIGIVPLSACWLISDEWWWLVLVQTGGGIMWSAYELAMFLMFFEDIRAEERTSVMTTYNLAHAVATLGGGLLGGTILATIGPSPAGYLTLFRRVVAGAVAGAGVVGAVGRAGGTLGGAGQPCGVGQRAGPARNAGFAPQHDASTRRSRGRGGVTLVGRARSGTRPRQHFYSGRERILA